MLIILYSPKKLQNDLITKFQNLAPSNSYVEVDSLDSLKTYSDVDRVLYFSPKVLSRVDLEDFEYYVSKTPIEVLGICRTAEDKEMYQKHFPSSVPIVAEVRTPQLFTTLVTKPLVEIRKEFAPVEEKEPEPEVIQDELSVMDSSSLDDLLTFSQGTDTGFLTSIEGDSHLGSKEIVYEDNMLPLKVIDGVFDSSTRYHFCLGDEQYCKKLVKHLSEKGTVLFLAWKDVNLQSWVEDYEGLVGLKPYLGADTVYREGAVYYKSNLGREISERDKESSLGFNITDYVVIYTTWKDLAVGCENSSVHLALPWDGNVENLIDKLESLESDTKAWLVSRLGVRLLNCSDDLSWLPDRVIWGTVDLSDSLRELS